jgi:hypothetical protein
MKFGIIFLSLMFSFGVNFMLLSKNFMEISSGILKTCPEFGMETKCYGFKGVSYDFFRKIVDDYITKIYVDEFLFDENCWVNKDCQDKNRSKEFSSYVVKKMIKPADKVFFIGDFHASVHSLIRILLQLSLLKVIDSDFKIRDKNHQIVFLGDYINRGSYGTEVVSLVCHLKLNNWNNVILLKGNNEDWAYAHKLGFEKELIQKFFSNCKSDVVAYANVMKKWFSVLPSALFLKIKESNNCFVQCSHGGIQEDYSTREIKKAEKFYEKVANARSFCWGDIISANNLSSEDSYSHTKRPLFNQRKILDYFEKNDIKAFFRGHQDKFCGVKFLPKKPFSYEQLKKISCGPYLQGPYPWKNIIKEKDYSDSDGFQLSKYFPVVTLTSASQARSLNHDCFCSLTFGEKFEDWKLKIYEIPLQETNNRHKKYVSFDIDEQRNIILPKWTFSPESVVFSKKLLDAILS